METNKISEETWLDYLTNLFKRNYKENYITQDITINDEALLRSSQKIKKKNYNVR